MKNKFISLNEKTKSDSEELDKLNQQINEAAKKDKEICEILERVVEGKTASERGYFISPYAPKKSRWQAAR